MGLALGGGIGWATRKCGMTADNILAADVILADGTFLHVDDKNHSDIFWGIRGGGGNLGIVAQIKLQLHDCPPEVYGGFLWWEIKDIRTVLQSYVQFTKNLTRDANLVLGIATPPQLGGTPHVFVLATYLGPKTDAEKVYAAFLSAAPPKLDLLSAMSYVKLNRAFEDGFQSAPYYVTSRTRDAELDENFIDAIEEQSNKRPPWGILMLELWEGKVGDLPDDFNAWGLRKTKYNLMVGAAIVDESLKEEGKNYTKRVFDELGDHFTKHFYFNYNMEEASVVGKGALSGNYEKLQQLKKKYDPHNVFFSNNTTVLSV